MAAKETPALIGDGCASRLVVAGLLAAAEPGDCVARLERHQRGAGQYGGAARDREDDDGDFGGTLHECGLPVLDPRRAVPRRVDDLRAR